MYDMHIYWLTQNLWLNFQTFDSSIVSVLHIGQNLQAHWNDVSNKTKHFVASTEIPNAMRIECIISCVMGSVKLCAYTLYHIL